MTAAEVWHDAIAAYQKRGYSRLDAMGQVVQNHPKLHAVFIMEHNMKRQARK